MGHFVGFNPQSLERVIIFIDGTNFYESLKEYLMSSDMNGKKYKFLVNNFAYYFARSRKYIRTYFYTTQEKLDEMKEMIYGISGEADVDYITVKLGAIRGTKLKREKQVDILMASDILRLAYKNSMDTAILISGDEDFVPVVKEVKDLGKHVEIYSFEKNFSNASKAVGDRVRNIEYLMQRGSNLLIEK